MATPPTTSSSTGGIPLQEFRRDIPPGWIPGDPNYPLKLFFEKLKLWYRTCTVEDECVGPLIAGRLYGRAAKVAMGLRVPRPDGGVDVGDSALVRLSVDEVRDPTTGAIIQNHIPSGVQCLANALRQVFGQQDQDLATSALEKFFSLTRAGAKLSLAEYAVEFDVRYDEAQDRAGLHLNEVGKFFLWFKNAGIPAKTVDDIKLQVAGDYNRFQDARALALRLSPNREHDNEIFYGETEGENHQYDEYGDDPYFYDEDWWYGYGGYEEDYDDWWDYDEGWYDYNDDEYYWQDNGGDHEEHRQSAAPEGEPTTTSGPADEAQGDFYKGKGKGGDEGCFNCGSKWHMARDCPLGRGDHGKGSDRSGKGKSKGKYGYGGGYRKGKGKSGFRPWSKGRYGKGKGKGKFGKSGKGKGKSRFWYTNYKSQGLDIDGAMPNSSTETTSKATNVKTSTSVHFAADDKTERYFIHTSSEEEDFTFMKRSAAASSRGAEGEGETDRSTLPRSHTTAFNFAMFHAKEMKENRENYFNVRGAQRHGLLIDPGAASGLIGSDTLKELLQHCVAPYGKEGEVHLNYEKTTPVSGINGGSDSTLAEVSIPLTSNGQPLTYTAEVIGGSGSMCPALVGNPTLRRLDASIFTNWFENGDGLMIAGGRNNEQEKHYKFFRLLLTDSGHYLLPTDRAEDNRVTRESKREVMMFAQKIAEESMKQWSDVRPHVRHCFLTNKCGADGRTGCDRSEPSLTPELNEETITTDNQEQPSFVLHQQEEELSPQLHDSATEVSHAAILASPEEKAKHEHNDINLDIEDAKKDKEIYYRYDGDTLPQGADEAKLRKRYKAIPEEFYTTTGLCPVTPENFPQWFSKARGKGLRWHAWEIFSGSGRLSLILLMAGLIVGFPVDYRYGWDLCNPQHQKMIRQAQEEFQPGYLHLAPDCAPWSVSSTSKDPQVRYEERMQARPSIQLVSDMWQTQSRHSRGYNVEQPLGSSMWQEELPENPLRLARLQDYRKRQRVDQCMRGAMDENKQPIQKATGFGSNVKWNKTAIRCNGHHGIPHAQLRGQGPGGLSRTSTAAVYPRSMCQRMRHDIVDYLYKNNLLRIKRWPEELRHFAVDHYYSCIRCQLGRACPPDEPHTFVPKECRYGAPRYAGMKGHPASTKSEDPLLTWKKHTNRKMLESITINDTLELKIFPHERQYVKQAMVEIVEHSMTVFDEIIKMRKKKEEFDHWITSPVHLELFKEIFERHLQVKGIRAQLRPWHKSTAEPKIPLSSSYLRLFIIGNNRQWQLGPLEDMREMSHNQINQAIDEMDWMVTLYGVEVEQGPSPSTPSSRTRSIPPQPSFGPRKDDRLTEAELRARPDDMVEQTDPPYEEFETKEAPTGTLRPNYNLRRVLTRLPKLYEEGNITRVRQLLLGLHERMWHSPASDFCNLLRRAGLSAEILNEAMEAVKQCPICRKYVRLPNRPQMRARGAIVFNEAVQLDLFFWESNTYQLVIDEATRFKACSVVEGQEAEQLFSCFMQMWVYMFGPPGKVIMDQQMSLMSHESGGEFERLGMERCPRGTTSGHGADQHTGTGIVERHVQLMKLTMYKLRAELQRQGLDPEPRELGQEAAMSQNITLSYGGVTPAMTVFGTLPRGFYETESRGLLSAAGAMQTDLTVFERAMRIRQTALAQCHQAVAEDRIARAGRSRPHQLDITEMVAGTTEIEFYREVKNDIGWRGPALLLRLDADEGVAVIQYRGKPYLVALRFIRPYRGIYHVELQTPDVDNALEKIMRYVEMHTEYKIHIYGWIMKKNGQWTRLPKSHDEAIKIYQKAEIIYKSMTTKPLHGVLFGRALRSFKPPKGTVGTLITWIIHSRNYSVQEYNNDNHLKMKRITNYQKEDTCVLYFYTYTTVSDEPEGVSTTSTRKQKSLPSSTQIQEQDDGGPMAVENQNQHDRKRDGPESRTVVISPEKKKQRIEYMRKEMDFLENYYFTHQRNYLVQFDITEDWRYHYDLMTSTTRTYLIQHYIEMQKKCGYLFTIDYKTSHRAQACLRTARIYKVDQETDNINDDEITPEIWQRVDEADSLEVKQFVDEKAFKPIHKLQVNSDMVVIDCRWVRKWKRQPDRSLKIKSRLCARGCLDSQKSQLTTRSTTATRLSQRMLVSQAARSSEKDIESWDIAGAFLKGFSFQEIQKALQKLGLQAPTRQVVVYPPLNVWRHLQKYSDLFKVPEHSVTEYGLLCLKPIYGLNDAPLAWQLCLHTFVMELGASRSKMDENWEESKAKACDMANLTAMMTTHVDDLAITASKSWLERHYELFVQKFKKVTRQHLPFSHCGCRYSALQDGIKIDQQEFSEKITQAKVPQREDESKLTPEEVSDFRSILGALLWVTATRLDVIADISLLQSRVTTAQVKDMKLANQVLVKVKQHAEVGLYYRRFITPHQRLVCIHDASSANSGRHYAQEGIMVLLADDHWRGETSEHEVSYDDNEVKKHGGIMHVLHAHGGKAKRVSYSTSHAETLSMVNGLESTTLVMTRLSELMLREKSPTLDQLVKIQEGGNPMLSCDYCMDCKDLWELITGSKVLPQDKSQRLYILGIREARLVGQIRLMILVPTESMLSDALTKPMLSPGLLMLLTSGKVEIFNMPNHDVLSRIMPSLQEYDENDLVKDDGMILKDVEKMPQNVKASHATILLGMAGNLLASTTSMKSAMLLGAMATGAMAEMDVQKEINYVMEEKYRGGTTPVKDFIGVYFVIFLMVILAIKAERYTWQLTAIIARGMQIKEAIKVKVKEEDNETSGPMDVDQSHLGNYDEDVAQLHHECHDLRERLSETQSYLSAMERSRDHFKMKADQAETNLAQRISDEYDETKSLREERDRLLQDRQATRDRVNHMQGQLYTTRRQLADTRTELEQCKKKLDKYEAETDGDASRKMPRTEASSSAPTPSRVPEEANKIGDVQKLINQMNEDMDEKNIVIRDLKDKIRELENKIHDLDASDKANDQNAKEYKAFYERTSQLANNKQVEVDRLSAELLQANLRCQAEVAKEKVPDMVYLTRSGECFHKEDCNHLRHGHNPRPRSGYSKCRDCWR